MADAVYTYYMFLQFPIYEKVGIRMAFTLGHQLFLFHIYVQFDVVHNQFVITSNVDLVDDRFVCDDIWPAC